MTKPMTAGLAGAVLLALAVPVQAQQGMTPPRPLPDKSAGPSAKMPANVPDFTGSVGILIFVGKDGSVKACAITKSSGNKQIDTFACEGVRNARFEPARDASGKAIDSGYATDVDLNIRN